MNLIGKRFGRLEVISNANKHGYVTCRCDCGRIKDIRSTSLTKQKCPTRSCGCIQKEFASSVSAKSISKNSEKQVSSNRKFNTNFGSIVCDKPKNNTSGHKGVSLCKSKGMWETYISVHNKRIHLGRYHDIEDAVKARIEAEEKYFDPLLEVRNNTEGYCKMTWGEKYDKIIKRNQDIGVKEFIASKTSPTCVLVQYRDDRYKCTFCGNVVVGDSRYCPKCGAWNKSYDSQFYDLYDDDGDEYEDYEDDDYEEEEDE